MLCNAYASKEREKEYINNLCTKCNVETDEESEDDDIYLK